jgi:hypothetical protein
MEASTLWEKRSKFNFAAILMANPISNFENMGNPPNIRKTYSLFMHALREILLGIPLVIPLERPKPGPPLF